MYAERVANTTKPVPRTIPARLAPLNGKNQIEKIAVAIDSRVPIRNTADCFITFLCLIVLLLSRGRTFRTSCS